MANSVGDEMRHHGGFFAVDRRCWAYALGTGLNGAITYLVLACGTGNGNRRTSWSVQAVEKYTGIGRKRAKTAIEELCREGVLKQVRGGTKPLYDIVPWAELSPSSPVDLTPHEEDIFQRIKAGLPLSWGDETIAHALEQKGLVKPTATWNFYIADTSRDQPDWVWLPNSLVTGVASEASPLERVRQTQDVETLGLLVDLYRAQDLPEEGGVGRRYICWMYDRARVGQYGEFVIWGFKPKRLRLRSSEVANLRYDLSASRKDEKPRRPGRKLIKNLRILEDLGLVEWVEHLFEGSSPGAKPLHPLGLGDSGQVEDLLGGAARRAALDMITEGQRRWAERRGLEHLVPIVRHVSHIRMFSILRLRYRAHTRPTSAWWADLNHNGAKWIDRYEALCKRLNPNEKIA
jgi:hypothetical protein